MFSVILAVSYQSLHILHHHSNPIIEKTDSALNKKKFKIKITEKEECHICDFKFASFLSPKTFTYSFYVPFKESPYSFSVKEALSFFCGSLFSLRGPPSFI
ncbi:conserved hypothetical protein [Flavobacterium sp. 9AF]|nr:conserved hypothetical protein [Flavobacterium sp. 9AF]